MPWAISPEGLVRVRLECARRPRHGPLRARIEAHRPDSRVSRAQRARQSHRLCVARSTGSTRASRLQAGTAPDILRHLIVRTTRDDREAVAMLVVTRNDKALRAPVRALLASADRPDGFFININDRPGPFMVGERTIKIDGASHVRENDVGPAFLDLADRVLSDQRGRRRPSRSAGHRGRCAPRGVCWICSAAAGSFPCRSRRGGARVVSVEENRQAVKDADANRRLNRVPEDRLRLICARVENALPRLSRESFDAVVLDPPRDGCGRAVLSAVFTRMAPPRVVYVSCNPDALASELPDHSPTRVMNWSAPSPSTCSRTPITSKR